MASHVQAPVDPVTTQIHNLSLQLVHVHEASWCWIRPLGAGWLPVGAGRFHRLENLPGKESTFNKHCNVEGRRVPSPRHSQGAMPCADQKRHCVSVCCPSTLVVGHHPHGVIEMGLNDSVPLRQALADLYQGYKLHVGTVVTQIFRDTFQDKQQRRHGSMDLHEPFVLPHLFGAN